MAARWYALHSKPHKEDILWQQLLTHGFETFYPRLRVQPVNPRSRTLRPYFPGYLFVRADLEQVGISIFRWMPGAVGLVHFGGVLPHVPDLLITALQLRLDDIEAAGGELFYRLQPGDRVCIQDGPFAGYEAIFDARLDGKDRVRVLLEFMNKRVVPMEVRAGQLRPVAAAAN
jgi:transcriptional antiterminator RfaH